MVGKCFGAGEIQVTGYFHIRVQEAGRKTGYLRIGRTHKEVGVAGTALLGPCFKCFIAAHREPFLRYNMAYLCIGSAANRVHTPVRGSNVVISISSSKPPVSEVYLYALVKQVTGVAGHPAAGYRFRLQKQAFIAGQQLYWGCCRTFIINVAAYTVAGE